MAKLLKGLLIGNAVLLVWVLMGTTGSAQRPPQANADGIPFFNVNINPTEVPPMVNINPHESIPRVDVVRMPEIRIPDIKSTPFACDARRNFQTGIAKSISGPLVLTYMNLPHPGKITLDGRTVTMDTPALATAIYLKAGQRLDFEGEILYSGCIPD